MLTIEPHAGTAPVVQVIQSARHAVDVNVYFLSSRPILDALRAAHARGVVVRVILDEHPYGIQPWRIRKEAAAVRATGAMLHWAPERFEAVAGRWAYDHAKYVVSGQAVEIGTANFDYSAFHKNREYLYTTSAGVVVHAARTVFDADWSGQRAGAGPRQVLVLSPGSGPRIISVIAQPGPVSIETEEMGDDIAILDAISAKGRLARVILPSGISTQDQRNVDFLLRHGVQVRFLPRKPLYLHAKMIVGNREAFVGSENFSVASLDANREMGLLLNGRDIGALQTQFDRDWARSQNEPGATAG